LSSLLLAACGFLFFQPEVEFFNQKLCYAGGKLIEYYYTLPFRAGIATCVIEVQIPQLTTSDLRPYNTCFCE